MRILRMFRRARGGEIPQRPRDGVPIVLSPGMAVVPDSVDPDLVRRLNGEPTIVVTASEALAALDED